LQQASEIIATYVTSPTYFYNIHKNQMRNTFETIKTPETYIDNIGERPCAGRFQPLGWELAACEHH
jgi:hypothetical protein